MTKVIVGVSPHPKFMEMEVGTLGLDLTTDNSFLIQEKGYAWGISS